ncbi:membrane protein CcdC involved in cytochrome C biogenesis [Erwinia toletana]|uniref:Membrane protein CcdC involved in cytochrome C biogenesis n=2 Tax=Winslowiella toletana TaxID=92490 RepID=A0ABS4PDI2_9GAMM|nr:membrane protein CcdC involved in cytochrome C biogenesis [Winslowiella toletana]
MSIVWPITGLYMPFFGWLAWWYLGRNHFHKRAPALRIPQHAGGHLLLWQRVFTSTSLCAAACVLGTSATVPLLILLQHLAIVTPLWLEGVYCLLLSLLLGVLFQFLIIRQTRSLRVIPALLLACRSQTFPLVIYQLGILFTMSLALKFVLHDQVNPMLLLFWFMLQVAMIAGFLFSWPASTFLLKHGKKAAL